MHHPFFLIFNPRQTLKHDDVIYGRPKAQARMFPKDAATGARRAASMYDDYYEYDYGDGLEAIRDHS